MHPSAVAHVPVMLAEVTEVLAPALAQPGAVLVDATLGLGGHSVALLKAFPNVRLIGIDRDPKALAISADRLSEFGERVSLHLARYDQINDILGGLQVDCVDGVLMDLGVSSMQLDLPDRGFAYSQDAPLDMRMNPADVLTAADVVNTYDVQALARILREYGEERFATRIAQAIVRERGKAPFTTSSRLSDVVKQAIPAAARRTGGNPLKRTFQALRIEVNNELGSLRRAMPQVLQVLCLHGRIAVLTYHSLEDRIVKQAIRLGAAPSVPAEVHRVLGAPEPWLRLLTRGGATPGPGEVQANSRAASARLRAAERIGWAA